MTHIPWVNFAVVITIPLKDTNVLIQMWKLSWFAIFYILESSRATMFDYGVDPSGFFIGYKNNFIEVLGKNKWLWCLPIWTR